MEFRGQARDGRCDAIESPPHFPGIYQRQKEEEEFLSYVGRRLCHCSREKSHRKCVPNHLSVHKLVADVTSNLGSGWNELHVKSPVCYGPESSGNSAGEPSGEVARTCRCREMPQSLQDLERCTKIRTTRADPKLCDGDLTWVRLARHAIANKPVFLSASTEQG